MITLALRLFLALTSPATATTDQIHEYAHHACEVAVYAVVAPDLPDDETATTPLGESLSEVLCRNEPDYSAPANCTYDPSYDCDGPDGEECAPYDCH